jgi:hypothetical protein
MNRLQRTASACGGKVPDDCTRPIALEDAKVGGVDKASAGYIANLVWLQIGVDALLTLMVKTFCKV